MAKGQLKTGSWYARAETIRAEKQTEDDKLAAEYAAIESGMGELIIDVEEQIEPPEKLQAARRRLREIEQARRECKLALEALIVRSQRMAIDQRRNEMRKRIDRFMLQGDLLRKLAKQAEEHIAELAKIMREVEHRCTKALEAAPYPLPPGGLINQAASYTSFVAWIFHEMHRHNDEYIGVRPGMKGPFQFPGAKAPVPTNPNVRAKPLSARVEESFKFVENYARAHLDQAATNYNPHFVEAPPPVARTAPAPAPAPEVPAGKAMTLAEATAFMQGQAPKARITIDTRTNK